MDLRQGRTYYRTVCVIAAMALPAFVSATAASPALIRTERCMLNVLKTTPGVTEEKLGMSNLGTMTDEHGWIHPYLEYRASEKARWTRPTRFDLVKPQDAIRGPYDFESMFPGVFSVEEKGPDTHVTDVVVRKWKAQCGVHVSILFE
jgi:hypothetical protein